MTALCKTPVDSASVSVLQGVEAVGSSSLDADVEPGLGQTQRAGLGLAWGDAMAAWPAVCILPAWLPEALRRLDAVALLGKDWDDRGSRGTDPAVDKAALSFLVQIALRAVPGLPMPTPFVCPIPGGTLQIEWDLGVRHIEIEFLDEHRVAVLQEDASLCGETMWSAEFPATRVDLLGDIIDWLVAPQEGLDGAFRPSPG